MTHVLHLPARQEYAVESPATPTQVPRWCVLRFPAVGSDAVTVIGFDGEGYPLCKATVRLTSDIAMWEHAAKIEVESAKKKAESRPPLTSLRLG